ncbi:DNA repair protein RadA [Natranaerofaba carboxydovora]|uniref:DNA repair protein RadA n=1 Tax=Natranaerofaba carboxydovora TaxID=2742683 RepID=UPI001F13AE30|nr:DNA repair protein RadA [Natranaerofaba carboxydovora]UMZ75363.1 DNA repair protein RadA [Natranaerofaba carboxydovora]
MTIGTNYVCNSCGYITLKWMGKCPDCDSWNTLEQMYNNKNSQNKKMPITTPVPLTELNYEDKQKVRTEIVEVDRVLGGGIFPGASVLLGGNPGIGKSTLMLQIAYRLAEKLSPVYYLSGEESPPQILDRCKRLNTLHSNIYISSETNWEIIENEIDNLNPKVIIVDSIQTIYYPELGSLPGSLKQVKECSSRLVRLTKDQEISCFIIGHVTKDGEIAGPKVLEHMVDTVLSFEGEKQHSYRILRSNKNRFGAMEIGVFEMRNTGLMEVNNPSKFFLNDRTGKESGSCVTASMEGTRPVLIEVQSLIGKTNYTTPRRMTTGVDYHRVLLIIAVLEKRLNLSLGYHDVFVNVVGGLKIKEPSVDLAVALSLVSSYQNRTIDKNLIAFGEIGLTGEVRSVTNIESRLTESKKMGYKAAVIPPSDTRKHEGMDIIHASNLKEALSVSLN